MKFYRLLLVVVWNSINEYEKKVSTRLAAKFIPIVSVICFLRNLNKRNHEINPSSLELNTLKRIVLNGFELRQAKEQTVKFQIKRK